MASVEYLMKKLEEKRARQAEREKRKKEKEKEKKRLKQIERRKKSRQKINKRYYDKKRKAFLEEKKKVGDERAFFMVYIVKNKKRKEVLGTTWWKTKAYEIYNDAIEKNRKEVTFPVKIYTDKKHGKNKPVKYEILIVQKIKGQENQKTQFRDETGRFIDTTVTVREKKDYVIVAKDEWFLEETFYVYGYHPVRNRKTYQFILNEILLKDITGKDDIRTVITYNNKVFIRYFDDFDFIICKSSDDAQRLYSKLQKDIPKQYKKNIIFLGEVVRNRVSHLLDEMVEKTGWLRQTCRLTRY